MTDEFELCSNGTLPSLFVTALETRKIDLVAGAPNEAHPLQALAAGWRGTCQSFMSVLDELTAMETYLRSPQHPDPDPLLSAFRNLTYTATELFDVYLQLIPARLNEGRPKSERKEIGHYVSVGKRFRDPVALLCNKFKHGSRQLLLTKDVSDVSGAGTFGYMVGAYSGGDTLSCDREVHKSPENLVTFRKKLHEILHGLLRVDSNAAALLSKLTHNSTDDPIPNSLLIPVAKIIPALVGRPVYVVFNESRVFDGLAQESGNVVLVRMTGNPVPGPSRRSTMVKGDGITRSFGFA